MQQEASESLVLIQQWWVFWLELFFRKRLLQEGKTTAANQLTDLHLKENWNREKTWHSFQAKSPQCLLAMKFFQGRFFMKSHFNSELHSYEISFPHLPTEPTKAHILCLHFCSSSNLTAHLKPRLYSFVTDQQSFCLHKRLVNLNLCSAAT